jgi:two-component system, OmpR family, sensor histidine kinase MprB
LLRGLLCRPPGRMCVVTGGDFHMGALGQGLDNDSEGFQSAAAPEWLSLKELRHDLRQPLAAVRLLVDTMLSTTRVPPEAAVMLDRVQQQTEWMLQLLGSDMDQQPQVSIVDLADIAQSPCLATPTGAPYRERVHAEHDVLVLADPVGLQRAVWNLLDNARRAVADGGEIEVRVRQRGREALLEIADSGPGFGYLQPQHGLGLIGVRRFAERFGGDFSVGTSSFGGALVTLRLPSVRGGDVRRGR